MTKSIDERLFEQLMRAPHAVRKNMISGMRPERCPTMGSEGHGPRDHGHGPHGFGRGPEGHGPECRGPHGPEGHGPHGPGRAFGRERLLGVIAEHESGVRQKVLTEELGINPSSVSEFVSRLQNEGYVKRTIDPEDKRATLIVLTELGEARAAELADERQARFARLFSALTDEEKEQLIALLGKLTEPKAVE